jgi:hypothetical protein
MAALMSHRTLALHFSCLLPVSTRSRPTARQGDRVQVIGRDGLYVLLKEV